MNNVVENTVRDVSCLDMTARCVRISVVKSNATSIS